MSKTLKTSISIVVVVAIAALTYTYFLKPGAKSPLSSLVSSNGTDTATTEDTLSDNFFLQMLLNLQAIKLNTTVFDSTSFQSLKDQTTQIEAAKNAGRPNPFAPVGYDASTSAKPASATR